MDKICGACRMPVEGGRALYWPDYEPSYVVHETCLYLLARIGAQYIWPHGGSKANG